MTRITGTLHEDQYTFCIISRSFLLRMRNVSDIIRTEYQNTLFVFRISFLENRAVYEIMSKNILGRGKPQTTVWHKRVGCWIPRLQTHTQNM